MQVMRCSSSIFAHCLIQFVSVFHAQMLYNIWACCVKTATLCMTLRVVTKDFRSAATTFQRSLAKSTRSTEQSENEEVQSQ